MDSDPAVRAHAAVACHRMGEPDQALKMLKDMSRHVGPVFRAQAAWAMGEIGSRQCVFILEKLRDDPEPAVRTQVGEALSKLLECQSGESTPPSDAEGCALELSSIFAAVDDRGRRRVYISVCDRKGEPLTDLTEEDFHIEEGGVEIGTCSFQSPSDRDPLSLAYVLDCSGSMSIGKVREMYTAVANCIEDKQPEDRISLYKYAFDVERVVEYTSSLKRLGAVIKRPYMGVKTASRLHDATLESLDDVIPETGFRSVIVIADGPDRGSEQTYPAAFRRFRDALVPLYIVGYGCDTGAGDLGSLAAQSGGSFVSAENVWELNSACKALLRRLSNYYAFSYQHDEKPEGPLRLWIDGPSGSGELSVAPVVTRG